MSTPQMHDVIILGSGPAGLTAAIYASRANLKPLVIDGSFSPDGSLAGGQLMITTEVENYPGFPKGVTGPALIDQFMAQATRFGTELLGDHVVKADLQSWPFTIETSASGTYQARTLIIATGASAKWLGLESEKHYTNYGVSACATCDGAFFKGVPIGVVGGGDTAMEEAMFLTRFGSKVYVIHRRDTLRASKIMQERALKNPKIEFVWNSEVVEVLGTEEGHRKVTGLRLRDTRNGEERTLEVGAFFLAIGHKPNTDLFAGQLEMDETGYLLHEAGSTRTSIAGVFVAGDCADHVYRQAITAAGTGCMAAIDAERWLEAKLG